MLTPQERYQLDLEGYVIVPGVFDAGEVARLNAALERWEGRSQEELPPGALASWTPVVNEYRIINILECDPAFVELVDRPEILRWVDAVVPAPYRLPEAYSISRRRGVGIPLHAMPQAESTAGAEGLRTKFFTAAINLTDTGPEDGPMVVFAGSHKLGMDFPYSLVHPDWAAPAHDREVAAHYLRASEGKVPARWEDIPGYREVCVRAGDLVFITEDLWHGAKELRSDTTRRSLYLGYSPYHHGNYHAVHYSERLLAGATPRQRQLLSGPFIGNLYACGDNASIPADAGFPTLGNSELGPERFRADAAESSPAVEAEPPPSVEDTLRGLALPETGGAPQGVCQLEIGGEGGGAWPVELNGRALGVRAGRAEAPDCVIEAAAADLVGMARGEHQAVELFYQGRLRARGDLSLAMRLADAFSGNG